MSSPGWGSGLASMDAIGEGWARWSRVLGQPDLEGVFGPHDGPGCIALSLPPRNHGLPWNRRVAGQELEYEKGDAPTRRRGVLNC